MSLQELDYELDNVTNDLDALLADLDGPAIPESQPVQKSEQPVAPQTKPSDPAGYPQSAHTVSGRPSWAEKSVQSATRPNQIKDTTGSQLLRNDRSKEPKPTFPGSVSSVQNFVSNQATPTKSAANPATGTNDQFQLC